MVFITLWLQLLGFSDFAASLLMALFALGSALGGLLGGAIGAQPFSVQTLWGRYLPRTEDTITSHYLTGVQARACSLWRTYCLCVGCAANSAVQQGE